MCAIIWKGQCALGTQKGEFSKGQELCLKELTDKLRSQKKEQRLRIGIGKGGNGD